MPLLVSIFRILAPLASSNRRAKPPAGITGSQPVISTSRPNDDGIVVDNKPFTVFDENHATAECGYMVNGRLHAVRGAQGETLYGKLKDKVVTRKDGGWIASLSVLAVRSTVR